MNKTKNPNYPSKNILDSLLKNYKNKEFNYVESQAILITKDYPHYSFGIVFRNLSAECTKIFDFLKNYFWKQI